MGKPRLLVVEDDHDISTLLHFYFSRQNYDVDIAPRGADALEKTRLSLPHLIILDIMLPDIDGFEVCRILRTNLRTSHVPIIFLTQKDERVDRLTGLELGADDYVTKPFDIEEFKLRVQRAIQRSEQQSLTDPRSGLPSGKLIEDQLRRTIRRKDWALIDVRINHCEAFKDVYGFVAGSDVIRFTGMLANEVLDELGSSSDFLGHTGGDNFIIITSEEKAPGIRQRLKARFADEVQIHYSFMDREQGFIQLQGEDGKAQKTPFMSLAMGIVSPKEYEFADIREITEIAAEVRRKDLSR